MKKKSLYAGNISICNKHSVINYFYVGDRNVIKKEFSVYFLLVGI